MPLRTRALAVALGSAVTLTAGYSVPNPVGAASDGDWRRVESPNWTDHQLIAPDVTGQLIAPSLAHTWAWNGTGWRRLPTIGPQPDSLRGNSAIAYDPVAGLTILVGTSNAGFETWAWNGALWTQLPPSPAVPSPRAVHSLAFDRLSGGVLLFGGYASGQALNDTWLLRGGVWTQLSPSAVPTGDVATMTEFDVGGSVVLATREQQMWAWNGITWSLLPFAPPNAPRFVFDPVTRRLLAPTSSGIYVFDYVRGWQYFQTASAGPSGGEMAMHAGTSTVVVLNDYPGPRYTFLYSLANRVAPWAHPGVGTESGDAGVAPAGRFASDDCASGTAVAESRTGGTYVGIRHLAVDARTSWLCVRVDDGVAAYGGKFTVETDEASATGGPASDENAGACQSQPGNVVPGPHPIMGGEVFNPNDPSRPVAYALDAYDGPAGLWVCVRAGSFQRRLAFTSLHADVTMPGLVFEPDVAGRRQPLATPPGSLPSAQCAAATTNNSRVADVTAGGQRSTLWLWHPNDTTIKACARAEGPLSAGGVLTVTTNADFIPVTTSTDLTPCTTTIVDNGSPVRVALKASFPVGAPQSVCLIVGTTGYRVTVAGGPGAAPAVSWTPDPGSPGVAA